MRLSSLLLIGLAGLSLFACKPGNFSKRSNTGGEGVLRYPIPNTPTTLDPGIVRDGDTLDLLQQIYEGLVGWDENNEVVGKIAESWTISDDGTLYTFKLRPGVKFHNGREVTAEDVKWSFERISNPGLKSVTADAYLSDVVGFTEKVNGEAKEISGIQVVDPSTITIQVERPTPYFLGKLTYLVSAVVPKESFDANAELTDFKKAIGTGPFKLVDYRDKQLAILEANEDYWGGRPKLDRIERPVILDSTTRLNKYMAGELDIVQIQRKDLEGIESDPQLKAQVKTFPRPAIHYVGMAPGAYAPFKDRRVRRAFAMCIDRERIVNELMGGHNTVAYSIVPPGVKGHRDKGAVLPYDPAAAKKLLAEAGYPNGEGLPPLEMRFREGYDDIKLVGEAVAASIKANLGVEVVIQPTEWRKYLEDDSAGKNAFFHMRWAADYLDPQNFLSHMLASYGPENHLGYKNEEFDALCREADSMMDMSKRLPLYAKAEDIVLQDAVWVPIYFQRDIELHKPTVGNIKESLFGHLPHVTTTVSAADPKE